METQIILSMAGVLAFAAAFIAIGKHDNANKLAKQRR